MIREKWSVGVRNKIANIAWEMDSCAAINGARMSKSEREYFKNKLIDFVNEWDAKISL